MPGDGEAGFEAAFGFLANHVGDDFGGVSFRGVLVAEDQLAGAGFAFIFGETLLQVFDVPGEHLEVDALFGRVDCCSSDAHWIISESVFLF